MKFESLAILSGLICCCGLSAARAEEPRLKDPQWWFARAGEEQRQIVDPEARHLVGEMLREPQGVTLNAAEFEKILEQDLARCREQFPGDADWRCEMIRARHYRTCRRYREALAALLRARELAEGRFPEPIAKLVRFELNDDLDLLASDAVTNGEAALALEIAAVLPASTRNARIIQVAHHQARQDIEAARTTIDLLAPEFRSKAWRKVLFFQCQEGHREFWRPALESVLEAAPGMNARELEECYGSLWSLLGHLRDELPDELLTQLEAQLQRHTRHAEDDVRQEATSCLAALAIARKKFDDAIAMGDSLQNKHRGASFRQQVAGRLIAAGEIERAMAVSPHVNAGAAVAYLKVGKPQAALAAAEKVQADEIIQLLGEDGHYYNPARGKIDLFLEVAKALERVGDQTGVEHALAALDSDDQRIECLGVLSAAARKRGDTKHSDQWIERARKSFGAISDPTLRERSRYTLAKAWLGIERYKEAMQLQEGPSHDIQRLVVLVKVAEQQVQGKKVSELRTTMSMIENVLEARRLVDSAEPEAPAMTEEESIAFQMDGALACATIWRRAGDDDRAKAVLTKAFARADQLGGLFWRYELYAEHFSQPAADVLQDAADLLAVVPGPTDRALIAVLAGALAAQQLKEAAPRVIQAIPAAGAP